MTIININIIIIIIVITFYFITLNSFFNKAILRYLVAVADPVIIYKLDKNHQFFRLCDPEIWRMTSIINRVPLLYHISFVYHLKSLS